MSSIPPMMVYAIMIGIVLLSVGFALYRVFYEKKLFRQIANELGGYLTEGRHIGRAGVNIRKNDRLYSLERFTTGSGDSKKHWHRISVAVRTQMHHDLDIYKETILFSKIGKAMGGQDVIIGHNKFDRTFIIKTTEPQWLKSILHVHLINKHIRYSNMRVELNSGTLTVTKTAQLNKPAIMALFELSHLYAEAIANKKLEQRVRPQLDHDVNHQGQAW